MLRSISSVSPGAFIWVLCLDDLTQKMIKSLEITGVIPISYAEIKTAQLDEIRSSRSTAEFCWTLSSYFTAYVMQNEKQIDLLTYLDADLYFFSSVEPIFEELEGVSIGVIEHRYTSHLLYLQVYGVYNVQWVSFRRDTQGLQCLYVWRDQCIEWCYSILEKDRFGDQKYLDYWPKIYDRFRAIKNVGAGLAPWNYSNYKIEYDSEKILVDNSPLIFYHFHQFQILGPGEFNYCPHIYTADGPPPTIIYSAYSSAISAELDGIREILPSFSYGIKNASALRFRRLVQALLPRSVKSLIHKLKSITQILSN